MKLLITAGGQGTKLWPYSRTDKPKQFQPIVGEVSSYQHIVTTLLEHFPAEDIYVSTKRKFIRYVSEQSPQISLKNYIVEPDIALDRGPAEGLAFLRFSILHPEEPFFVIQADCVRTPDEAFIKMIQDADKLVREHKRFITGGIKAMEANMGTDYLQLGDRIQTDSEQEVYAIESFLFRKSTLAETRELVQNFHVATHSNHACWFPDLMLDAYKQYRPDWHDVLMKMRDAIGQPGEDAAIEQLYSTMAKGPTEDVTQHVMDSGQAMAIILPFKWTDVGTWQSVYDFFSDGVENHHEGTVVAVDSRGSLIKSSDPDKLIAVAGLDDVIVINTDDALLVIAKDKIDQLKQIQAAITDKEITKYL